MIPTSQETDINLVLLSHDKRIREAGDVLSRLYRITLRDCVVSWQRWATLLNHYLDRQYKGKSVSMDKITNDRNNLRKGLGMTAMSIETFAKGIGILNPLEGQLKFTVTTKEDVSVTVPLRLHDVDPEDMSRQLATVFDNICELLGKNRKNLSKEIDVYLDDPRLRVSSSGRQRGNDKGNLKRELSRDTMTFEVFKKGLRVLAPKEIQFKLILKWTPRKVTTHELRISSPA